MLNIKITKIKLVILLTVINTFIFNLPVYIMVHLDFRLLIINLCLSLIVFLMASINKYSLWTVFIMCSIFAGINATLLFMYGLSMNGSLVLNIFNSIKKDIIIATFSYKLVFMFLLFTIAPVVLIVKYIKIQVLPYSSLRNKISAGLVLLLSFFIIFIFIQYDVKKFKTSINKISPINTLYSIAYASISMYKLKGIHPQDIVNSSELHYSKKSPPLDIVLIIGESANAKHQHYNGYARNTNYYLEQEKNIVFFHNVLACRTYTVGSLPCMLGHKSIKDYQLTEALGYKNVISVFNKANFHTYWLGMTSLIGGKALILSAQDAKVRKSRADARSSMSADEVQYDSGVLKFLNKYFDSNNKYNFIILHMKENHFKYHKRYPRKFAKFMPESSEINSYDNAALYGDYIKQQYLHFFKNRNALVFYFSDHGESIREEGGRFGGHGANYKIAPKEQRYIAGWAWASDKYLSNIDNSKKFENIKKHSNQAISHDYVFHSLLDCANIKHDIINQSLSLCR